MGILRSEASFPYPPSYLSCLSVVFIQIIMNQSEYPNPFNDDNNNNHNKSSHETPIQLRVYICVHIKVQRCHRMHPNGPIDSLSLTRRALIICTWNNATFSSLFGFPLHSISTQKVVEWCTTATTLSEGFRVSESNSEVTQFEGKNDSISMILSENDTDPLLCTAYHT